MTVPINIPQNHFKWGDYDGHVFEKKVDVIYEIIVYWEKNFFMPPTGPAGKLYKWNHIDTRICYETYNVQSNNDDAIPHTTETQSQLKSKGSFWSTLAKNDSLAIWWLITTV